MKEKLISFFKHKWMQRVIIGTSVVLLGCLAAWGSIHVYSTYFSGNVAQISENETNTSNIPYHSFVLVQHKLAIMPSSCILSSGADCIIPPGDIVSSRGSGTVVGHGLGMSHILTAAHVCQHRKAEGVIVGGMPYEYQYMESVNVVDFYGNTREGLVIATDIENDLCLISVEGQWADVVDLSDSMPDLGEQVQNMAAPMGIFSPGMVLMFDGRYAGIDQDGEAFFTIPSYAGSSGSSIINSSGQIVGIIHSATRNFNNVAIATEVDHIESFLSQYSYMFQ